MELIDSYNKAKEELYDHVGFTPDWVVCPIDDCTDMLWCVDGRTVRYAETKEEFQERSGNYYKDELYTQRFYSKHIYEGQDLTMVMCDPHVDGMRWFRFFSNSKRQECT